MHYAAVVQELRDRGAFPGHPMRGTWARMDGWNSDAAIAQESSCEACDHIGLSYEAWTDETGAYRAAVARCPRCHDASEF